MCHCVRYQPADFFYDLFVRTYKSEFAHSMKDGKGNGELDKKIFFIIRQNLILYSDLSIN